MESLSFTEIGSGKKVTLDTMRGGKKLVVDFWHTKCTRCPAALEKLDTIAASAADGANDIVFAACGLSLGDGDQDLVEEMCEGEWENLTHHYMTVGEKEAAKAAFGFAAVPFCCVIDAAGALVAQGDPKTIDFTTCFAASAAAPTSAVEMGLTFDDDF